MSENLFNSSHKATNEEYRSGYERTFGKKEIVCFVDEVSEIPQEVWDGIGKIMEKDAVGTHHVHYHQCVEGLEEIILPWEKDGEGFVVRCHCGLEDRR